MRLLSVLKHSAAAFAISAIVACGQTASVDSDPSETAVADTLYQDTFERAKAIGLDDVAAKEIAEAAVNGEDVEWALVSQTDTGGEGDYTDTDPSWAIGTGVTISLDMEDGLKDKLTTQIIHQEDDVVIFLVTGPYGGYHYAEFSGLFTTMCEDEDVPDMALRTELKDFMNSGPGSRATIVNPITNGEDIYVMGEFTEYTVSGRSRLARQVVRSYEKVDDNGEPHVYEENMTVIYDPDLKVASDLGGHGTETVIEISEPTENENLALDANTLGTCSVLLKN